MLKLEKIEPTVFFVQENEELEQIVELTILNPGEAVEASMRLDVNSEKYEVEVGTVEPGERTYEVKVPDFREHVQVQFTLYVGEELQDETHLTWNPMRHWQVYVVQESHHDLGYTDLPQHIFQEQNHFVDNVLEFCEETDDWPEESRFRYSIEQSCSVVDYVENRPKETVDELMKRVKEGRIEIPALYANLISDMMGHEELIRALYPSSQLRREYGIPIKSAEITDVPGFSWALPMIMAGSGVSYFTPGMPRGYFRGAWGRREEMDVHPFWDESKVVPKASPAAFSWVGPDGSKVLFWYGPGYGITGLQSVFALQDFSATSNFLPRMLADLQEKGYPFDAVRLRADGGYRDNAPPSIRYSYVAREWNRKWVYPKIIIATNSYFFDTLENICGGGLPEFRGELPNTDYTVAATCTPYETGLNRVARDSLLSAEKFGTIAAAISDYPYPYKTLKEAYCHSLLFAAHCWGHSGSAGLSHEASIAEKVVHAYKPAALAEDVLTKSLNKIVDQINLPREGYHIVVFNSLSWERTDVVTTYLREIPPCSQPMQLLRKIPEEWAKMIGGKVSLSTGSFVYGRSIVHPPVSLVEKPFDLIDEVTGEKVSYQLVEVLSHQDAVVFAAYRYALAHKDPRLKKAIVFVAEDVPPMGYKTYRIVPSEHETTLPASIKRTDTTLENRFYKITVNPKTGAIESIYDKELGKELVDKEAPHGFNQYIVRSPSTGEEHPAEKSLAKKGREGPVLGSITIKGEGTGCPQITQELTIYDRIKRIDVANRILMDSTPHLEVYFAFPFRMDNPEMKFEATDSVITPIEDQFPGSCTDYYAIQHWVNVSNEDFGVTFSSVDAHMVELGGLWPGYVSQAHHCVTPPGYGHEFLKPGELKKAHIYSYVMNNNFRTNFSPTRTGDVLFRYSITTHKGDWKKGRSRDFGWAASTPLIPVFITGEKDGTLPLSQSFCKVDRPNVMVLNVKVAEDKEGIIVRLIETEGTGTVATVTLPFTTISDAYLTNLVEERKKILASEKSSVSVPIKALGIATVRIVPLH